MTILEIIAQYLIRFLIIIGLFGLIDFNVWTGIRPLLIHAKNANLYKYIYLATSILTIIGFITTIVMYMSGKAIQDASNNLLMGIVFIIVLPKIIFGSVLLIEDIVRLLFSLIQFASNGFHQFSIPGRLKLLSQIMVVLSIIVFIVMTHGIFFNKYNYKVKHLTLHFPHLPKSFEGYKIVQISDVHSGSLDNPEKVKEGIVLINKQRPDLVLFTGDLVNMTADEFIPYIPIFKEIQAKDGKFSILGNHDYGDYVRFETPKDKFNNLQSLFEYKQNAGFNLLRNSHSVISKGGDTIYIAGVENWGHAPFPKRGNLKKAIEGIPEGAFIVLMSHDPSHWDSEVSRQSKNIALTLSGHTHGMQFGIDFMGIRWSPVQWKYPLWSGLFKRNNMKLYVNVGFGFIGMPGRIGILPEITVITLKK